MSLIILGGIGGFVILFRTLPRDLATSLYMRKEIVLGHWLLPSCPLTGHVTGVTINSTAALGAPVSQTNSPTTALAGKPVDGVDINEFCFTSQFSSTIWDLILTLSSPIGGYASDTI